MKTKYKSVLVIDDHKMVANGIRFIIGSLFENFYMAYDGATGMSKALQHFPELIIVDYALPDTSGELLVRELKFRMPSSRILGYSFTYAADVIVKMFRCGINGYIIKKDNDEEFLLAVHTLMNGRDYFCKEARNHVIGRLSADEEDEDSAMKNLIANTEFSAKQITLIKLLCKQMTTREIGLHLNLTERTVEQYRSNISQKIGAKNLAGIVKFALQNGILELDDL